MKLSDLLDQLELIQFECLKVISVQPQKNKLQTLKSSGMILHIYRGATREQKY